MDWFDSFMPIIAMVGLQFCYAAVTLSTRAALLQGISPRVLIFYRQSVSALVVVPITYFSRKKSSGYSMGVRSFSLIFLTTLTGITVNQNINFEGVYLASSSIASAMFNLVPAITFVLATIVGLEKVNIRSLRSIAKIFGTLLCVGGAVSMALLKGTKLLNSEFLPIRSILSSGAENWLLGCLLLFTSSCLWAIWLILQVPVTTCYPDHVSLTGWMSVMATFQSGIIALIFEGTSKAWNVRWSLEFGSCLLTGLLGSGLIIFVQAWVISRKGPVFSAMFNPLSTIIVTIVAAIFLHEQIYIGSLAGAIAVIIGLYAVLWGKAKDVKQNPNLKQQNDDVEEIVQVLINDPPPPNKTSLKVDLQEPLLADKIMGRIPE